MSPASSMRRRAALRTLGLAAAAAWTLPARADDGAKKKKEDKSKRPKIEIPYEGPPEKPAVPPEGAVPKLWFPVNEVFVYSIKWSFIHVGTSVVWSEWIEEKGRWLLALRLRTRSNRAISTLYPVNDYVESIIDPQTFLPLRFVKKMNEGSQRYDELTCFDHAKGVATWESFRTLKKHDFKIGPQTRDIPALLWWLRQEQFEPGKTREFEVMADEKTYKLTMQPEKWEKLSVGPYGRIRCLKIEPKAEFGGVFVRSGRMWGWVSEDARRIMPLIVATVPVGSISLQLDRVEGPGDDFWVQKAARGAAKQEKPS